MSFFLALDPDELVRAQVAACIERHRAEVTAKWLRTDKLHLTLLFLGHPSPAELAALQPVVEGIARTTRPFSLSLRGVGFFTTARAPSVLWLGVEGQLPELRALQSAIAPTDERPFVPHLTLARAQSGGSLERLEPALRDFASPPFVIDHVTLYESTNEHYRALFRCALVGGG